MQNNLASSLARFALCALALAACGRADAPGGPGFDIAVAPLSLPGITDTCYRVTVTNGPNRTGDIVWQKDLCADVFGDGVGALSYVGPCDADVTTDNSVTLELLDLKTGATPIALDDDEYRNPCGEISDWSTPGGRDTLLAGEDPYGPCTIDEACAENRDTPVVFDLTVMRRAHQGFFDVAVEFDDIFCSAKLDCKERFLHDADGDANATAIVAFACTAGDNEQTRLQVSDLVLTCTGTPLLAPIVIPAAATPGQHGPIGAGIFQHAVYQDDEQLTSNGQPLEKCFWNRAIGLDLGALAGRSCTLSGLATASEQALTPAQLTTPGTSYPAVTWSVEVLTAQGGLCTNRALDVTGSGVATAYLGAWTPLAVIAALTSGASFTCGFPEPLVCAAGPTVAGAPSDVAVTLDEGELRVRVGASATALQLPGYTLAGCHRDVCCTQ